MARKERLYLTAISIQAGIITLISDTGVIECYRQRGIGSMDARVRQELISRGLIRGDWQSFKELPSNYSIEFEDPEIMGKARASFPDPTKKRVRK